MTGREQTGSFLVVFTFRGGKREEKGVGDAEGEKEPQLDSQRTDFEEERKHDENELFWKLSLLIILLYRISALYRSEFSSRV